MTDTSVEPVVADVATTLAESGKQRDNITARINALDAVRGFAVFGMLLRNIFVFGIPPTAFAMPLIWSNDLPSAYHCWAFVTMFADGSMRGLFSLLFGASALMILQKVAIMPGATDIYHRRLMWLMALGLVHAYILLSPIDILFVYGLLGFLIFPLRNMSARILLITASAGAMINVAISAAAVFVTIDIPDTQINANPTPAIHSAARQSSVLAATGKPAAGRQEPGHAMESPLQAWANTINDRRQGYLYNVLTLAADSLQNHSVELFTRHFLDVGTLFLIGMAFFKLGIITGQRSVRFYLIMLAAGYGAGLSLTGLELIIPSVVAEDHIGDGDWTLVPLEFGRILVTFGHLALVILLCRVRPLQVITGLLRAAGRLALTNYVAQTLVCTILFFGYGFGYYGKFSHTQLLVLAFIIGIIQLIVSKIYLRYYAQGPLEWLLRRLVMWKPRAA